MCCFDDVKYTMTTVSVTPINGTVVRAAGLDAAGHGIDPQGGQRERKKAGQSDA